MTRTRVTRCRFAPRFEALEGRDLPSFITAPAYPAGPSPDAIAAGRFDGDGIPDLAILNNTSSGTVTILKGNGDASFAALGSVAVGPNPTDMIAAELTGDTILDLAVVVNTDTNNLHIFRGNGDGTFMANGTYTVGLYPHSVVAADFDLDGDLDLATANVGGNDVGVLLNNGAGDFTSAGNHPIGGLVQDMVAGDFNNDGVPDLVTVGWNIDVLIGQGDGSFVTAASYDLATMTIVTAGDFNADGALDLAAAWQKYGMFGKVDVLLGNGDGTFAPSTTLNPDNQTKSVVSADLEGDGYLDLIVTNFGTSDISVFRGLGGSGDGSFQQTTGYVVGTAASGIVAGDLDGDTDVDLAVTNATTTGAVTVLRNSGSGYFQPAIAQRPTFGGNLVAADFNADGTPDVALSGGNVLVIAVNADGTFGATASYTVGDHPQGIVAADFNSDGFPDLATANSYSTTVSVLINKGDGTFFPAKTFAAGPSPTGIGAADFTGDGKLDIVVTNNAPSSSLSLLRGTGSGRFRAPLSFEAGLHPGVLAVADFDDDGDNDVAVGGCPFQCDDMRIILGNGNASFASPVSYVVDGFISDVETADHNGDGIIDLYVAADGQVFVLQGNGDGTFSVNLINNPGASSLEIADINRDGAHDLVLTGGPLKIMFGNGNGTFQAPLSYPTGDTGTGAMAVADFNGDDWPDVVTRRSSAAVALVINAADWAPMPIPTDDGLRPQRRLDSAPILATSLRNDANKSEHAADLPRSGYIAQPRVAQRTLGEPAEEVATLKGLNRSPQLQPFQGRLMFTTDDPGCAARPWAEICIPFGEIDL